MFLLNVDDAFFYLISFDNDTVYNYSNSWNIVLCNEQSFLNLLSMAGRSSGASISMDECGRSSVLCSRWQHESSKHSFKTTIWFMYQAIIQARSFVLIQTSNAKRIRWTVSNSHSTSERTVCGFFPPTWFYYSMKHESFYEKVGIAMSALQFRSSSCPWSSLCAEQNLFELLRNALCVNIMPPSLN